MTERLEPEEDRYCTCTIDREKEDYGNGLVQCLLCGKQTD